MLSRVLAVISMTPVLYLTDPGEENVYKLIDHLQNVEGVISAEPCPRGYIDDPLIIS